jgi:hypothetical protein
VQFLPWFKMKHRFEDRADTLLQLIRVAAALAVHRAELGYYPTQLGDVVPALLS